MTESIIENNAEIADNIEDVIDNMSKSKKRKLQQLPNDQSYIAHESQYIGMWEAMNLYSKIIEKNMNSPEFVFIDGPPFVSGKLHQGHAAISAIKSAMFNFKSMKGMKCQFKLGYDCHGLPIETLVCKENALDTPEKMGLKEFNKLCDQTINRYTNEWTPIFQQIGRLAEFKNVYMTRDITFMESTIWVFKQLWEKGLVYKGNKVLAYSYGNQTPLSNFEAANNYKTIETKSIYVSFELEDKTEDHTVNIIAWTTTPWTLCANLALCVNPELDYVEIKIAETNHHYIIGKKSINNCFNKKQKYEIIKEFKGLELVGKKYKPLFHYTDLIDKMNNYQREYKIVADTYVTSSDIGTSVVHLSPAFGNEDYTVCEANGIINNRNVADYCPIDKYGKYTDLISEYAGMLVFDAEDLIREKLKNSGRLLKTQVYKHSYPYCERSETPLIYRTTESYYVNVQKLKDRMVELNQTVNWYPEEIGKNRFNQWLLSAKDWAISRYRFYGTPIPLWISDTDPSDVICIGSIQELETLSCQKIDNLHPEYLNDIVITKNGSTYRRIPDIFDCWFESGSVPMAQMHYPFCEDSKQIESREHLSDFICEGMDQTRGWFYTLLILSTAIFDKSPYKNVMCTGMILDEKGEKICKRKGNAEDQLKAMNEHGADTLRAFYLSSPLTHAEPLKYDNVNINQLKKRLIPYINGVKFWIEHTLNYMRQNNLNELDIPDINDLNLTNLMDKWIIIRTNQLIQQVNENMENYHPGNAVNLLIDYIDDLTNWYIKFNRDRLKGHEGNDAWRDSIYVLYNVLIKYCIIWAPTTPFLSEHIFQHLSPCSSRYRNIESILLCEYPGQEIDLQNQTNQNDFLKMFNDLQKICTMVRCMRDSTDKHSKMVVPLKTCTVCHDDENYLNVLKQNIDNIASEVNCLEFKFEKLSDNVCVKIEPNRKVIGQTFKKEANDVMNMLEALDKLFLKQVFEGTETIHYKSNNYDVVLDQQFYKLSKVPETMKTSVCIMSQISQDLMVTIDHTYDFEIHHLYQIKRIHSAIQKIRKTMNLRPWNVITVFLDELYADEDTKNKLTASLNNTSVVMSKLSESSTFQNFDDNMYETETDVMYVDQFEPEEYSIPYEKPRKYETGKLIVLYSKE